MTTRDYTIRSRYLVAGEGWKVELVPVLGQTYEQAGAMASAKARELDRRFGGDHFWTVDLVSRDSNCSYFQLFHGRLS